MIVSESPAATRIFVTTLFAILLVAQAVCYRESFAGRPANDDFLTLHQIERGDTEGIVTFFKASDLNDYRPLQNATYWLAARGPRSGLTTRVRLLHIASFAFYALPALLWLRALRLSRAGCLVAALLLFFHPTHAGVLAGFDNYTRFVVSGWVWLGAWLAWRHARTPWRAAGFVSLCLVIGLGYMEYAVVLIPLAAWVTFRAAGARRGFATALMAAALSVLFAGYLALRVFTRAGTSSGMDFLAVNPILWMRNAATLLSAVLFFGDTVPIALSRSAGGFAWMAINVTLVAAGLAYGLWKTADARHRPEGARALVLVAVAFLLSFFPMILMTHISEIYLTAATFALALLAGLSVRGWRAAPRPLRSVAAILAIAQLLLGVGAIQAKVARMNRVGERSESMARGLLEFIPDDGAPKRVAVVFPEHTAADPLSYSVFMIPDDQLLLPGYGRWVVRFFRPGQEIAVDQIKVAELGGLDHGSYDVVVRWDGAIGRFLPVPGSGRESR